MSNSIISRNNSINDLNKMTQTDQISKINNTNNLDDITIIRRNGDKEQLNLSLIKNKIVKLINIKPKLNISGDRLIIKIISNLYNNITTHDIDIMSANIAFDLIEIHSDYRVLVNRILDDRENKIIRNIKKNTLNDSIYIIRSNGSKEELDITLIYKKIHMLINMEPKLNITGDVLITKTINELADNITSEDIDFIASKNAANLISTNLDYNVLAARIVINRIHKKINKNYLDYMTNVNNKLNNYFKPKFTLFVKNYYNEINDIIDYSKDYNFKYIGISILIKSYLIVHNKIPIECPQQMYMRIAINLHLDDLDDYGYLQNYTMDDIKHLYELISDGYYTHATPTIFNSGNKVGSLSSCFLLDMPDTTMGIYGTLAESAMISKSSGGIGINITKIRGKNSRIASSNGTSEGLVPMLKVYDDMAKHMSQGGGKRKGSVAMYFELWHIDVMDVLECILPTNTIDLLSCPRDLFYAAWTNDIFWERLEYAIENPNEIVLWSLFCPNDVIDDDNNHLSDLYGKKFTNKYIQYENEKRFKSQINILDIWHKILKVLEEAGKLYIMSKSASNIKCNQNNLGTIKSSNLCSEILIYTDEDNIGVCNLASICLPKFMNLENNTYDYNKLAEISYFVCLNLNKVLKNNVYPLERAKYNDKHNRPIGIGVQGLADVFMMFKCSYTSDKAKDINKKIFESIYYGALKASNKLAYIEGYYNNYPTSMTANGLLQFDLWNINKNDLIHDWKTLRKDIKKYGLYNSLLVALMPTASTSAILDNNENFEPITSNIYNRSLLSGDFQVVNHYLIKDLKSLNLWDNHMRELIIAHNGSIQNIDNIPNDIKEIYKTAYEYKLKDIIDMDADRAAFVCQSQSSNRFIAKFDASKITSMYLYSYKKGLKTLSYYIRTKTNVNAIKFTIDQNLMKLTNKKNNDDIDSDDGECLICSA